jgi:PAS domain S-box-containing protein
MTVRSSSTSSPIDTKPEVPISSDVFAAAIEEIESPVVITSAELVRPGPEILYVNAAFTAVTGYTLEEVRGETPRILQGERTNPLMLDVLKRKLREDRYFRGETVNYRKDGSEYVIEWEITPVHDENDDVAYWVALQRDVTERHLLEREVLDVSTREQRRIAEDLHDNLGQSMSGILMRLRALQSVVDDTDDEELKEGFAELTALMKEGHERLRRHVRQLYPVSLADDGLVPGLRELASNAEMLYGVTCRVRCETPLSIESSDIATHLYRITQEAITNAVKHGHATVIEVRIWADGDHLTLTIENNGSHIGEKDVQDTEGMGVRIMQQRARAIQAGLEIRPSQGGTEVIVSLKNKALIRTTPE